MKSLKCVGKFKADAYNNIREKSIQSKLAILILKENSIKKNTYL